MTTRRQNDKEKRYSHSQFPTYWFPTSVSSVTTFPIGANVDSGEPCEANVRETTTGFPTACGASATRSSSAYSGWATQRGKQTLNGNGSIEATKTKKTKITPKFSTPSTQSLIE